ncbi:hypothetical protein B0J14DRAFT_571018 [Halenospora varia]|nr:hypothetical protein B0J14DRAFT_571018 [Halenospora varia]
MTALIGVRIPSSLDYDARDQWQSLELDVVSQAVPAVLKSSRTFFPKDVTLGWTSQRKDSTRSPFITPMARDRELTTTVVVTFSMKTLLLLIGYAGAHLSPWTWLVVQAWWQSTKPVRVSELGRPRSQLLVDVLNKDRKSYSFDSRGVGYGRGEGAAIVVLKNLDDTIRDGDHIRGIIRSSGVGQLTIISNPEAKLARENHPRAEHVPDLRLLVRTGLSSPHPWLNPVTPQASPHRVHNHLLRLSP